jgi:hypothetical protein
MVTKRWRNHQRSLCFLKKNFKIHLRYCFKLFVAIRDPSLRFGISEK